MARLFVIPLVFFTGLSWFVFRSFQIDMMKTEPKSASQHRKSEKKTLDAISAKTLVSPTLNISNAPWQDAANMPRAITHFEHDRYIELVEALSRLFLNNHVTFIMCDGTLLGSYIGHDMLPWDDDIDIMVSHQDLPKVKRIFRNPELW